MSQSSLFNRIGAPLKNIRWSWGAIRSDDSVVLRVWKDEFKIINNTKYMRITFFEKFRNKKKNLGYLERLRHIELIKNGSKVYMIMCIAADNDAVPRVIASFNSKEIFIGGKSIQIEDDWWVELVDCVSVKSFQQ